MIQDIAPSRLENSYQAAEPDDDSRILLFAAEKLLVFYDPDKKNLRFPEKRLFSENTGFTYLFAIDREKFFLLERAEHLPAGYHFYTMEELRNLKLRSNTEIFAIFCAYHLWKWYLASRYCGSCGAKMTHAPAERALVCPACGHRIYPRLNPAVIIGVINGDRILITRYRSGYQHNALVAGFIEFGETLEEAVRREVMEETGLRVKNIRYYKSQPWGISADLLVGFYCEVDGDDTIHMDRSELKYAEWVARPDIVLQPSDYSLTNAMMKAFKEEQEDKGSSFHCASHGTF